MQIQVDYVEKDTRITLKLGNDLNRRDVTGGLANQQHVANWGLARISHKQWRESSDYFYDDTAGNGVRVYVVDSGIRCTHQEFQPGRAVWGTNLVAGSPDTDEFGHGTHVAGTVGGATYGVAKKATLVAVKVLDVNGEGAIGQLLAGIDFAIRDAEAFGVANSSVINISLGAKLDPSINEAVDVAVNVHGMTVAVAAGNDHKDSTNYSPASAPSVLTVGAIVGTSFPSAFTNFGPIVDIYAPGVSILSAGIENDNATKYLSGTSQGGFKYQDNLAFNAWADVQLHVHSRPPCRRLGRLLHCQGRTEWRRCRAEGYQRCCADDCTGGADTKLPHCI